MPPHRDAELPNDRTQALADLRLAYLADQAALARLPGAPQDGRVQRLSATQSAMDQERSNNVVATTFLATASSVGGVSVHDWAQRNGFAYSAGTAATLPGDGGGVVPIGGVVAVLASLAMWLRTHRRQGELIAGMALSIRTYETYQDSLAKASAASEGKATEKDLVAEALDLPPSQAAQVSDAIRSLAVEAGVPVPKAPTVGSAPAAQRPAAQATARGRSGDSSGQRPVR